VCSSDLRALLAGFATDPASIVWLATDGGAALGYVLATSHSLAVQRRVALRAPDMWLATASLLVRHPRTLVGVVRRVGLLVRPTKTTAVHEEATVRLLDIFVAPTARDRGVGQQLLGACLEWATAAGHPAIGLTVDATNEAALRLYQKGGFHELARLSNPDGHSSVAMERRLSGDTRGGAASGMS
jgi:ribosomal protein S18 acetylase RimI-like enzyme